MKTRLTISGFENKQTKMGTPYVAFDTDKGKMNCFDAMVYDQLRDVVNKLISVEITTREVNGKTFSNIKSYLGIPNEAFEEFDSDDVQKGMGDAGITVKQYAKPNGTATMYTSYAKDIYCSLNEHKKAQIEPKDLMELAIDLVKQAKSAFE